MSEQFSLFADSSRVPEGLRHATDFVSPEVEQELIAEIARLPLQPFQFGAYEGKRRVASFGYRYDYRCAVSRKPIRSRNGSSS